MGDELAWALQHARQQTLPLVADVTQEHMCLQSVTGEHHPTWILGHLLLADTYLLSLLEELARPTPDAALAQAQPTLGHHLQALVAHEGYHGGQLSS